MNPVDKLVPFGILEVLTAQLTVIFGTSRETSDFIVDRLLDQGYQTGVRLTKAAMRPWEQRLARHRQLGKWHVSIVPKPDT